MLKTHLNFQEPFTGTIYPFYSYHVNHLLYFCLCHMHLTKYLWANVTVMDADQSYMDADYILSD